MGTPAAVVPNRAQLCTALRDATIALSIKGTVGTGFFVAPGLVLTCAHVVADAFESSSATAAKPHTVKGKWRDEPLELEVVPEWFRPKGDGGPDLALLRVRGEVTHPVACLSGAAEPDDPLWTYGYPEGPYRNGEPITCKFQGSSRRIDSAELYRVAADGRIVGGFSGSPMLNWRTGMVCGIMRLASNPPEPPLARLIPADVVLCTYYDALSRHDGGAYGAWLNLLEDDQLLAGGIRYPGPWLRGYLTAVCHVDEKHRASDDDPDSPGLLEVYQLPQLNDPAEGLVDVTKAGIGQRDILVVGDPGAGKSSLLRWVRHQAAQRLLAGEDVGYVPVLLPARALAYWHSSSFYQAIADAVSEELGPWLDKPPSAKTFEQRPMAETPWLILVDGFEEILTREARNLAIDPLSHRSGYGHLRLLMTSRPLQEKEFQPFAEKGIRRFSLAPFDLERVKGLTTTWLALTGEGGAGDAAQRVKRFVDEIEHGQIKDLARIPLVTMMLCILHAADSDDGLPQNRYDLYEQFINKQLHRQLAKFKALSRLCKLGKEYPGGKQAVKRLLTDIRTLLTAFALQGIQGDKPAAGLTEFSRTWTKDLRPGSFPVSDWEAIVMDVLRQSGLVIGDDISHRTIADFLAAQEVVQDPQGYDITLEQATRIGYLLDNRSLLSFVAAGWAQHCPDRLRSLCEILAQRSAIYLEFLATLLEDGVKVPPDVLERVAAALATDANNPTKDLGQRVTSAAILTRFDRQRALPRLRLLALDPRTDGDTNPFVLNERLRSLDVTRILMRADPEGAVAVLNIQVDDPARPAERRLEAAKRLLELDPIRGAAALERLINAPAIPRNTRIEGLRALAQADTARALEMADRLATNADLAVGVAVARSEFAPDRALDALTRLATDASLTPSDRILLALRWAHLRPGDHVPRAILASLVDASAARSADLWEAISALAEVDPAQAAPLLQDLADQAGDVSVRARVATLLSRLRPEQAGAVLAGLGDISGIEPQVALDLFTTWASTSALESTPDLAAYIRAMIRRPYGNGHSEREECFPKLVELLRQADPERCAAELEQIIHEPGSGTFRSLAEGLWAELDPKRCGDHLVAVVLGRCTARGQKEEAVREVLGSAGERGGALLALVRMGDQRGATLAEEILKVFRPDSSSGIAELCLYAARAIAELDRDRGVDLVAELALDRRLDGGVRWSCAIDLMWRDESRAAEVFTELARDPEVLEFTNCFRGVPPNMVDMAALRELLAERIRGTDTGQAKREDAIDQMLRLDPAQALEILMQLTEATDRDESQWGRQQLAKALGALEITNFAGNP